MNNNNNNNNKEISNILQNQVKKDVETNTIAEEAQTTTENNTSEETIKTTTTTTTTPPPPPQNRIVDKTLYKKCLSDIQLTIQKSQNNDLFKNTSYTVIPPFYHRLSKNPDSLQLKIREEARALFLQKRSRELLDNNELKLLWGLLEKNSTTLSTLSFSSSTSPTSSVSLAASSSSTSSTSTVSVVTTPVAQTLTTSTTNSNICTTSAVVPATSDTNTTTANNDDNNTSNNNNNTDNSNNNINDNNNTDNSNNNNININNNTDNNNNNNSSEQLISYDDYLKVIEIAGEKFKRYLTASIFARLQSFSGYPGRVSIMSLFNYTMRKVWLQQTRIGLSLYDYTGHGFLREQDLEAYILELIPTLPQLEGLEKSFHSFYVCTAVRKFFFFLDPLRTGKIRIRDILACSFLDDLLELRDEEIPKDAQEMNWFSAPSALSVYGHYLNLDKNHNGMLSKEEFAGYGSGTLTSVFLDRVFSECLTYDGEMDYKTYLDFVLALENRQEPQSLHYLFRILDFEHNGYLTSFTLNYFFKGIEQQIIAHNAEKVNFEDVKDEIFDMIKPKQSSKITLKDLINSGQGETVVSILIEFHKFWAYENREAMVVESNVEDIQSTLVGI